MRPIKRSGLQLDDPLTPSHPPAPRALPAEDAPKAMKNARPGAGAPDPRSRQRGRAAGERPAASPSESEPPEPPDTALGSEQSDLWRQWSGLTGVGSFRLPHELLAELGERAREQGLPIGMIVTAAITQLLDQPPETIATLVDRADDARIQGRRRSRRRLITRSDD